MNAKFELHTVDGAARAGVLRTPHGPVPTPVFMPVATQGSVKTVTPQELLCLDAALLLGNTYHLYLHGIETVRDLGGLSQFMGWNGPTLTDSGGFQAYSLSSRAKITDDGIEFRSHIDGSRHMFTPRQVIDYQECLGADIIMSLDQCLAYTNDKDAVQDAMERTHRWAEICREAHSRDDQALFGIVQGGMFEDLREESASYLKGLDFSGYAIGGLSVGEPKSIMYPLVEHTAGLLPEDKPRYLMGVGSPEDLVHCVARGVDMFDCALPTRVARNGALFTRRGRLDIQSPVFQGIRSPVEDGCDCYTCTHFTAGYLSHLFKAKELLGLRLATIHNLRFVMRLMADMRAAIAGGSFDLFAREFLDDYRPADEAARLEQSRRWLTSRSRGG